MAYRPSGDWLDGRSDQTAGLEDSAPEPLLTLAYQSCLFTGTSSSKAVQRASTKDWLETAPASTQQGLQQPCKEPRGDLVATWELDKDIYPLKMNLVMATMQHVEMHQRKACTPCAYYNFRPDGCRMEADCDFCHLCTKEQAKENHKKQKPFQKHKKPKPTANNL